MCRQPVETLSKDSTALLQAAALITNLQIGVFIHVRSRAVIEGMISAKAPSIVEEVLRCHIAYFSLRVAL